MKRVIIPTVFVLCLCGWLLCCNKSAPQVTGENKPVQVTEPKKPTTSSESTAKKPYKITAAPVVLKSGATATGTFVVKPTAPWKLNLEYPTNIKLTPSAAVTVAKSTFRNNPGDAQQIPLTEKEMKLSVPITGVASGNGNIAMDVRFAVCTKETCVVKKETVAWKVTVSE